MSLGIANLEINIISNISNNSKLEDYEQIINQGPVLDCWIPE